MNKTGFQQHTGTAVPLDRHHVDTDAILPKQFLQKITRDGFGQHLFHNWRFLDEQGTKENPDFVLNRPEYRQASILLTKENFGCGSSREHAPWALTDYGFKVIIALSFADIFYGNALNNQLLAITLSEQAIHRLFAEVESDPTTLLTVDLPQQTVTLVDKSLSFSFLLDPFRKSCLLKGLDNIEWSLQYEQAITVYEQHRPAYLR